MMVSRIAAALVVLSLLVGPRSGEANFHLALIDEVTSGANGNASIQYVEIRMLAGGQGQVANTRLTVFSCDGSTSRVPKYKHMLPSFYELEPPEVALISVMMLRGPQTLGALRERSGRLHQFENLGEVQETLDTLMRRDEPLVVKLPPQPGQKEARFAHLLSGEVNVEELAVAAAASRASRVPVDNERAAALDHRVATLEDEVNELRRMFEEFRKQFE